MLDKNLPYWGVYMHRSAGTPVASVPLPEGFRFVTYSDGDELDWSRIETSVLEFDSEFEAMMHFREKFIPFIHELRRRCLFIQNDSGDKIATATAWWFYVNNERHPWLYWVAVKPDYQGLGLGKALISHVIEHMIRLEGDVDFYLHTQTWSYKAVGIYMRNGFRATREEALYGNKRNNYNKAMKIINRQLHLR